MEKNPEWVFIKPYPWLVCLPQDSAPQATVRGACMSLPLGAVTCSHVVSHVQPHKPLFESQLYVCLLHAGLSGSHLMYIAILRGTCY